MGKTLLITDTDLDGVSCGILGELFIKNIYIHNVSIDTANDVIVSDGIGNPSSDLFFDNYSKVYITDLAINETTANLIDIYNNTCGHEKVTLFDHHKSSEWMRDYEWANITVCLNEDGTHPTCGTELFWNHIQDLHSSDNQDIYSTYNIGRIEKCHKYVELVRLYDTFEWKKTSNGREASDMNALLTVYPRKDFVNNIRSIILDDGQTSLFTNEDKGVLTAVRLQKKKYFADKVKHMSIMDYNGYKVGVLFAESHISELGHWICDNNPEIDFVAMILMDKEQVSMRSTKEVDVSAIAQKFGGGGHFHAAGFHMRGKFRNVIFEKLFTDSKE